MKHLQENDFAALASGLGHDAQLEHVASCAACRDRAAEAASVVRMCAGMDLPRPRPGLEDRVVARLLAQGRPSRWCAWQGWAAAAAMVVLGAVLIQRRVPPSPPSAATPAASLTHPGANRGLTQLALADHLDRSQALLTALAHADAPSPRLQGWAADLLASNRLIEASARADGDAASAQLLAEMEPTLLQLAHFSDDAPEPQWRALKRRVAASGILFKVQVVDETLQNQISLRPQGKNLESSL